jgi:hypothetical protein
MTLGSGKEHVMKAKTKEQEEPFDVERFRKELGLKIQRLVAESLEAWPTCENARCRRAKRCASEERECIAKWRASLPPLSPEEASARMQDFRIELEVRKRLGGESVNAKQLMKAIRKEKAARRAAMALYEGDRPAPVVEETQLAPEQQARIERASNDDVASQPAEQDRARERRPRITQL